MSKTNRKSKILSVILTLALVAGTLGGFPLTASAAGQTVDVNIPVTGDIFGNGDTTVSAAGNGSPNNSPVGNTVNVNKDVSGGVVGAQGGDNAGYDITGNTVNIASGVTVGGVGVWGGYSSNGSGAATASGNTVNNSGTVSGQVYGGFAYSYTAAAIASDNAVAITNGGTANYVYGGAATSDAASATTSGNTVSITNGDAIDRVVGGTANGASAASFASGNNVTIIDTNVTYIVAGGSVTSNNAGNEAINNTVTLSGNVGIGSDLHGGYVEGGSGNGFNGNTLNVKNPKAGGITVGGDLLNFANLNFTLPASLTNSGTMLNVTGAVDLSGATVNVTADAGFSLSADESVILIESGDAMTFSTQSVTLNGTEYSVELDETATKLLLKNNAPTHTSSISPDSHTFTAATAGYGQQAAQVFTVTNTGTGTITSLSASLGATSDFEISAALSPATINAGNTATVSVRPKTGLAAGNHTGTLTVTGDNGVSVTASLSFTVNAAPPTGTAPTITTTTLPAGTVGTAYSQTLTATGTTPITWSITSGSLPTGLTLTANTGVISGTPTAAGTANFTVRAANGVSPNATKALSIAVNAAPPTGTAPTITTTALPAGTVGTAYSQTLTATGTTPIIWSITTGNLPAGLTLNTATGIISGTPTAAGTANFTVRAANGVSPDATKALSIAVNAPTYAVTVSSVGTGATGSGNYAEGATVNISAGTAPQGQRFKNWTASPAVSFANAAGASTSFTMIGQAVTVTANFENIPATVTSLTVNPSSVTVQKGTSYRFSATLTGTNDPPQGVTWSVSGNSSASTAITTVGALTVGADETAATLTVTAISTADTSKFGTATVTVPQPQAPTYTLTVSAGPGGTVSGTASGQYAQGAAITVTASPNTGYSFRNWTASGATVGNTAAISFTMPANAVTLTANFTTNGGGGTGGGSSAPTTPQTAPAADGAASVDYTQSGGNVTLTLPDSKVSEIIGKSDDTATIDLSGVANATAAILPKAALAKFADADLAVEIKLPQGTVTFESEAAKSAAAQTGGANMSVELKPVAASALNAKQQAAVGNAPVFDISVLSDGKYITDFGGGLITIALPYTLKAGEKAAGVVVWYLDASGNIQKMQTMYDVRTKTVIFTTGLPSLYAIGYDEEAANAAIPWVNPFADVKASDWFYGDVEYAVTNGLFAGTGVSAFSPNTPMTRAMIVTVLFRLAAPARGANTTDFTDVPQGEWYSDAVAWAAANGIVSGVGGGRFNPDGNVTREDLAVILYNYARFMDVDLPKKKEQLPFADDADIASYAYESAYAMQQAEIIGGKPGNLFDPQGQATRAEVAAMLHRFVEAIAE
jgi:hypothetical protein